MRWCNFLTQQSWMQSWKWWYHKWTIWTKKILKFTKHPKSNIDGDIINVINKVFLDLKATNLEFPPLKLHLLSTLRIRRSKHKNVLVQGVTKLAHPNTITFFSYVIGDNDLKINKGLLESLAKKHNDLKDRTTRCKHIYKLVPHVGVKLKFLLWYVGLCCCTKSCMLEFENKHHLICIFWWFNMIFQIWVWTFCGFSNYIHNSTCWNYYNAFKYWFCASSMLHCTRNYMTMW